MKKKLSWEYPEDLTPAPWEREADAYTDSGTSPPEDEAYARVSDPATSHAAAASVSTNAYEQTVLDTLRQYPDSTILEVQQITGIDMQTISPRFAPLRRKGMIVPTGKKKNVTGKAALTWRVVERKSAVQIAVEALSG
jgi:hypothetical protein